MAEQQSRLAIIIDSTGAQRNAEGLAGALARMTQAGDKASQKTEELSGATKDLNASFNSGAKYRDDLIKELSGATKATDQQIKSFAKLRAQIDPVSGAIDQLDNRLEELKKYQKLGIVSDDDFKFFSDKIEQTRSGLAGYASEAGRAGISSKQLAASMRLVPAQMTDIVVSLASGQAPLTVLLQQGGQLKDMFGGIGPAARALGGYVSGLINPFTLAGGAAGVFALALHSVEEQSSALNKSANSLSNTSGLNLSQFKALAQGAAGLGVSYGSAIDAVGQLTKSLSTNTSIYPQVIKASSDYAKASGQDLSEVVGMFNQLSANGGKSIDDLDDKFNFLTLAQRKQADEALRSGNIADAQRIAFGGLANKLQDLTNKLNQGATGWDKFWRSVGKGASGGWETIKEIAGGDYFDNADVRKYQERARLRSQKTEAGTWTTTDENYYQMLNKASPAVRNYLQAQQELDEVTQKAAGNQYLKTLSDQVSDNADAVTRARNALKAFNTEYSKQPADVRAASQADYAVRKSQLEKTLKDAEDAANRKPREKAYTEDASTRMLDQLRQQQQVLLSQADTGDKIGTQQQALIKWEQQLSDLKNKRTLTADQKSLLANADILTKQYQQNAALERQIETRQKMLALDKARADVQRTLDNASRGYASDLLLSQGGISQHDQQQNQQRLNLEQSWNDKITQLRQNRASATSDIAREEIDQEIQLQQDGLQRALQSYDNYIANLNQSRQSFSDGWARAWQEYKDSAANVSAMSQQLFTNAFDSMEDALVKFATTGKASFTDFANSVLADLARIAIRQSLVGIAGSASGMFGSIFGSAAGAASSASASSSFSSGAYNNLSLNAKGGVYDSPSLSAYSGGVYDSPKLFAFAKGAGVFGEAGPEAIMPLTRSSDGSLGVRMVGGDQAASVRSGDTIIHQTIQVSGNGDAALQRAMEEAARKGATDGAKQARQDMLQDFQNRGQGRRLLGV